MVRPGQALVKKQVGLFRVENLNQQNKIHVDHICSFLNFSHIQSWLRDGIFPGSLCPMPRVRDRDFFYFSLDRKIPKIPKSRELGSGYDTLKKFPKKSRVENPEIPGIRLFFLVSRF